MSDNALQKIEPLPAPATSVEGMITLAIERGATVETLERLMAIRREVRAEQGKEAFDRALAAFQAECPTIRKSAKVMNKDGRSVRYQYAPLDAIIAQVKELLQRHGFSYTVNAAALPGSVKATCKLTHAYGHSESSEFEVPIDKDAYMNPAQQVASALTFAKRYAFCNAAGIMTGDADDDSQGAFKDNTQKRDVPRGTQAQSVGQKTEKTTSAPHKPSPATQAPAGSAASPSASPAQVATEKTRAWFLAEMRKRFKDATLLMYGMDYGPPYALMPSEKLEDWALGCVPTSKGGLEATIQNCAIFTQVEPMAPSPPASAPQPAQSEPELIEEIVGDEPERPQFDENGDEVETMVGKLEQISEKSGTSAKGKWTRFGVKVAGTWFSTFNATLAKACGSDKGHSVRVYYKRGEKGNDLVGIERARKD